MLHNMYEMHNSRFNSKVHFEVVDDEMLLENINFPITILQAHDSIDHILLHNVHASFFFFLFSSSFDILNLKSYYLGPKSLMELLDF